MTGKQLRNSILQWAIQGKLVPQDPNDEPASVLLERIRAEKARLIKEKKIKRDKNESIIYRGEDNSYYEKFLATGEVKCIDDEIPFDIPQGWEWCRIINYSQVVTDFVASGSFASLRANVKYYDSPNFAVLVRTKDFKDDFKKDLVYTDEHGYKFLENSNLFGGEIILPNIGASIGKVFIVPQLKRPMTLAPNSVMVRFTKDELKWWFYCIFDSPIGVSMLKDISSSTAQGKFNKTDFKQVLIPVPPLKEQQRIWNKIKELDPLISTYNQFDLEVSTLNTNIRKLLHQAFLQEAIQGRLVPQIESEGTAEKLLEEIREEKKRLVKEGKLKKSAIANESRIFRGEDNKYYLKDGQETFDLEDSLFPIPKTWRWITLGELIADSTGLSYKKEDLTDRNTPQVRVLRGGNIEDGKMILKDDDVFIASKYVPQELYLKKGIFISPAVSSLEKIGKTAVISKDLENVVVGGFVLMLTPTFSDAILRQYLYQFFQSAYYHNYCKSITKKSGQAFYNLSRQKLKQCSVPIPPKSEIPRIMAQLDKALASIMSR